MILLEREGLIAQLHAQASAACAGPGRVVFVEGEAGIGKTSVLRVFEASLPVGMRGLWGACDAMHTPRPLGPLDEIAAQAGGLLAQRVAEGADRHSLFVAFIDTLAEQPTVVVLEDLHWADDATLDLLRYAARRIAHTRSLIVASLRSDEIVPAHPLRAVLGDLATAGVHRLTPAPLSPAAVHTLCQGRDIDAAWLHRQTDGNPFFVTEVLAAGMAPGTLPTTVADAVLARTLRLSPSMRAVLDAAAVAGPRVEPWLLQELTAAESSAIEGCLATGLLCADGAVYTFRHEMARQAVLQTMTPTRATSLHRLVLQSLQARVATPRAAARLALHAAAAGDSQAVRRWAAQAAREAAARGAHRQAAQHWAAVLQHTADGAGRAAALVAHAVEAHMSIGLDEAIELRQQAAQSWLAVDRPDRAAISMAEQALLLLLGGRRADAAQVLASARGLPLEPDSAAALEVQGAAAWLPLHDGDGKGAVALALPVLAAAEQRGDRTAMLRSLKTVGRAKLSCGEFDEGTRHLQRCLGLAFELHDDPLAAQVYANLGAGCIGLLRLAEAETWLSRGIAFCAERDLDSPRLHQIASWSNLCRLLGRWNEAEAAANEVASHPRATAIARVAALASLGSLRARRGDAGVWSALDDARSLAAGTGGALQWAVAGARAEAAWLDGRPELAAQEAAHAMPGAAAARHGVAIAEALLWRRLGGEEVDLPVGCQSHPCALEAAGRWSEAAQAWRALSCPFETARALSFGDLAAQREALVICDSMGARPLAERLRHQLRRAGAHGLPRGPRGSTQQHPAALTSKEIAVLELLGSGLRNKEIAQRLHRSPRTIEHHLQAIFAKLEVCTRAEAVSAAYRLGVVSAKTESTRI